MKIKVFKYHISEADVMEAAINDFCKEIGSLTIIDVDNL